VYDSSAGGELLGQAACTEAFEPLCVQLGTDITEGQTVYVSRQDMGKAENSRIAVEASPTRIVENTKGWDTLEGMEVYKITLY
jgi:hypothetical protein